MEVLIESLKNTCGGVHLFINLQTTNLKRMKKVVANLGKSN